MLTRTLDAGLNAAWVTGDTVYGSHRPLRAVLSAESRAYAMAVPRREQVHMQGEQAPRRVDQVARGLPSDGWQRLSAGSGSKGPRLFDWARVQLVDAAPSIAGWEHWLVIRRSITSGAKPAAMAYVLVFARTGTTLSDMVQAIDTRWTVEQCLEEAKGQVGLDEYARALLAGMVSSHHALYARARLSHRVARPEPGSSAAFRRARARKKTGALLHTALPLQDAGRIQTQPGADGPVMVPLSVAEVRRLFFALLICRPVSFLQRLAWSSFRRAHQAIARLCHYKRRLAVLPRLQLGY